MALVCRWEKVNLHPKDSSPEDAPFGQRCLSQEKVVVGFYHVHQITQQPVSARRGVRGDVAQPPVPVKRLL